MDQDEFANALTLMAELAERVADQAERLTAMEAFVVGQTKALHTCIEAALAVIDPVKAPSLQRLLQDLAQQNRPHAPPGAERYFDAVVEGAQSSLGIAAAR
jgi:hypothetical protein